MKSDRETLLRDLTFARSESCEAFLNAARLHRRNRARRGMAALGMVAISAICGASYLLLPPSEPAIATATSRSPMLTESELLDSFGDQPVALVTYPDGRQQLLAIARTPVRSRAR